MADTERRTAFKRQVASFLLFLCLWAIGSGTVRYSVPEEMESGSFVANVGKDLGLDLKGLSARRARIVTEDGSQYFQLNGNTGDLFIKEKVDREILCGQTDPCTVQFEIILENPLQSYRTEVRVYDVNDHSPVFLESELRFKIPETTPRGSRFPLESAQDLDVGNNSLQNYSISTNAHFHVYTGELSDGRKYAELVLDKALDREHQPEVSLLLTAVDGGSPPRSGTAQILVIVLDANDNLPVFSQTVYKARVLENSPKDYLVVTVSATDLDEGNYGEISYSFSQKSKENSKTFKINPITGEIRLTGAIDFEMIETYELNIQATDGGGLSTHCKVLVVVLDVNDNAPEVIVTSLISPILEDSLAETVVALFIVRDRDSGDNGRTVCSIEDDVPFSLKITFKNSYSLVIESTLDREKVSTYNITISVQDLGSPSLSTEKTITVKISDINDNSPEFSQTSYTLYVRENNRPGIKIGKVNAFDSDSEQNAKVTYSLLPAELLRRRNYGGTCMSASGNVDGDGNFQNNLTRNGTLSHNYRYEVCLTSGSGTREFKFLRPVISRLPAQHSNSGTDLVKVQDLISSHLNNEMESAGQQAQPNPDWRFSQAQRPGTSSSQNGEEGGAWPNNQFDTEMLQAMILASANEAADGNSTLGGGAGTMGLSTRYGPQFTLQHVPDYRQNVYIPGSTATLSNSSGKRDGKSSGSSGGNKKKSGKKEKK
ncbi:protocadherin beta-1-like isoform X23 [Dermochelys coriacea]|uniref:protocadherin beta-1-like isoform X23 n=1 Tax=Dermochelys coriacea TaxID=27794 RepID=UPI001CA93C99|nr:protocadherin beta-1-like isoform X23 [Dermochelys coriacea]